MPGDAVNPSFAAVWGHFARVKQTQREVSWIRMVKPREPSPFELKTSPTTIHIVTINDARRCGEVVVQKIEEGPISGWAGWGACHSC